MVEILIPKGCRLPTGVSSGENLTNHLDKGKQMTAGFGLAGAPLNESLMASNVYREGEARYYLAEPRLVPQGV